MLQCNFFKFFFRPNDSRMLVALGESYEKLAQQVEAKKVQSNSESTSMSCVCVRVQVWVCVCVCSDLLCVRAVLLEGLLGGGRGENGSAQTGKVSDCVKAPFTSNLTWTAVAKVNI